MSKIRKAIVTAALALTLAVTAAVAPAWAGSTTVTKTCNSGRASISVTNYSGTARVTIDAWVLNGGYINKWVLLGGQSSIIQTSHSAAKFVISSTSGYGYNTLCL